MATSVTTRTTRLGERPVVLSSVEPTGPALTLSVGDGMALAEAVRSAREQNMPFVAELTTTGVAAETGIGGADAWARAARQLVAASGVIPTVLIASGPVVSGPSLLLGLVDVTIFTEDAYAYVSGPKSVESYTGVPVSGDELGGVGPHTRSTGLASMTASDVEEARAIAADVLAFLPANVDRLPDRMESDDPTDRDCPELADLLPASATGSYDVRDIIRVVADDGDFIELRAGWAPNLITGFAAIGGHPIGVVANQTQALAGSIDIPAAHKGGRFVAMCDAFNVPLLTLIDTSGFLPGKDLEWRGMIRHGAQLAFAYARATVPRVALILRKSYGGAYIVMDSKNMGNDVMLAWPSAEVAVMGAKGAVEILHRSASEDERAALEGEYEAEYLTPYPAAERLSITSVVEPVDTRRALVASFDMLATKSEQLRDRRHDNGPL